jgi:4'-phosphopantetheinyl transferase
MTYPCVDRPGLSIGEIHVWTARLVDEHRATYDLLAILSREESVRAAQFSFERDRMCFIHAHGIVRQILSNYLVADAATLIFARTHHGKPYLIPRHLEFSVSRSGDCCMFAVQLDHSIGIDVEKVRDLPQAIDIVQSYFTSAESKALSALRGAVRRDAFFALWTHKEATVKGLGISLAAHLGRIEFDLDPIGGLRLVASRGSKSFALPAASSLPMMIQWEILRLRRCKVIIINSAFRSASQGGL